MVKNAKTKEEQKIQKVYLAFQDSISIEKKGIEPITRWLKEIQNIGSIIDLLETMVNMYKAGIKVPFGYYIGSDDKIQVRIFRSYIRVVWDYRIEITTLRKITKKP